MREATDELREARRLDPLNVRGLISLRYQLYLVGDYRATADLTRDLLELDPRSVRGLQKLGLAYMFMGKPDSAVSAFERQVALDSVGLGGRIYRTAPKRPSPALASS